MKCHEAQATQRTNAGTWSADIVGWLGHHLGALMTAISTHLTSNKENGMLRDTNHKITQTRPSQLTTNKTQKLTQNTNTIPINYTLNSTKTPHKRIKKIEKHPRKLKFT